MHNDVSTTCIGTLRAECSFHQPPACCEPPTPPTPNCGLPIANVWLQAVDAEAPPGKAPTQPLYLARTGRASLFPILQRAHGAGAADDGAGALDDVWLAHKGRRVVPGPELRRGRKNLFDLVHHTCVEGLKNNPHFTGAASVPGRGGTDCWQERRRKPPVVGERHAVICLTTGIHDFPRVMMRRGYASVR